MSAAEAAPGLRVTLGRPEPDELAALVAVVYARREPGVATGYEAWRARRLAAVARTPRD